MAYGARLESGLGVKALRGSNPLSSAIVMSRDMVSVGIAPGLGTRRSDLRDAPEFRLEGASEEAPGVVQESD